MEINGERHNILPFLPELIQVAARSPRDAATGLPDIPPFVYLPAPAGGFIRLPTDNLKPWLGALLELVGDRDHDFAGESLKLSRLDAMRTTAALGEGAVWEGAQHLREMVRRLSGRAELPEVPVPEQRATPACARTSSRAWTGCSFCASTGWPASWPTTWAWARRCRRWPTSRSKKTPAA